MEDVLTYLRRGVSARMGADRGRADVLGAPAERWLACWGLDESRRWRRQTGCARGRLRCPRSYPGEARGDL